eukprot:gb/GECH01009965.1/.p1 GENE.gb/GECH01009965.1/~~gb/GECH01009965.1/.p1  ORF type:complete len:626 (+),score=117.12 gb/GECH01009965.1/:1-1878(+)
MARNGTADVMDISDVPQDEDANSGEGSHRPVFTDNEEEDSALEEERYLRGWATGLEGASGAMVDGDEELFKGHMRKEGEVFKTWRRRFFVLRRNTGLAYYKTEEAFCEDMPPIRTVPVKDALVVPAPERDQPYCFKIMTKKRTFFLSCAAKKGARKWIAALTSSGAFSANEKKISNLTQPFKSLSEVGLVMLESSNDEKEIRIAMEGLIEFLKDARNGFDDVEGLKELIVKRVGFHRVAQVVKNHMRVRAFAQNAMILFSLLTDNDTSGRYRGLMRQYGCMELCMETIERHSERNFDEAVVVHGVRVLRDILSDAHHDVLSAFFAAGGVNLIVQLVNYYPLHLAAIKNEETGPKPKVRTTDRDRFIADAIHTLAHTCRLPRMLSVVLDSGVLTALLPFFMPSYRLSLRIAIVSRLTVLLRVSRSSQVSQSIWDNGLFPEIVHLGPELFPPITDESNATPTVNTQHRSSTATTRPVPMNNHSKEDPSGSSTPPISPVSPPPSQSPLRGTLFAISPASSSESVPSPQIHASTHLSGSGRRLSSPPLPRPRLSITQLTYRHVYLEFFRALMPAEGSLEASIRVILDNAGNGPVLAALWQVLKQVDADIINMIKDTDSNAFEALIDFID